MDALGALAGAIIGGLLVLIADFVRRRAQWRQEQLVRLVEAGMQLASTYCRLCGELRDARDRGIPAGDLRNSDTGRFEASSRFFMTPGSHLIKNEAVELIATYRRLVLAYGDHDAWGEGWRSHSQAVLDFERAVRVHGSRRKSI